jgi:hypothetical protein
MYACEAHVYEVHTHEMHAREMHVYEVYTQETHGCEAYAHEYTPEMHAYEVHVREMHAYEVHACERHAYEVHACEMHVYEVHTYVMHACEVHAHETRAYEMYAKRVFCAKLRGGPLLRAADGGRRVSQSESRDHSTTFLRKREWESGGLEKLSHRLHVLRDDEAQHPSFQASKLVVDSDDTYILAPLNLIIRVAFLLNISTASCTSVLMYLPI